MRYERIHTRSIPSCLDRAKLSLLDSVALEFALTYRLHFRSTLISEFLRYQPTRIFTLNPGYASTQYRLRSFNCFDSPPSKNQSIKLSHLIVIALCLINRGSHAKKNGGFFDLQLTVVITTCDRQTVTGALITKELIFIASQQCS